MCKMNHDQFILLQKGNKDILIRFKNKLEHEEFLKHHAMYSKNITNTTIHITIINMDDPIDRNNDIGIFP